MLHDLGKYTSCFQRMIAGGRIRCPHSIYGALAALEDPSGQKRTRAYPVAAVIAAHHGGLEDRAILAAKLLAKGERRAERNELQLFWGSAVRDQPSIIGALEMIPKEAALPGVDLFIRMLLSCLVDADRLDTAQRVNLQRPLQSSKRLAQLVSYLSDLETRAAMRGTASSLLQARKNVQNACQEAALGPGRLFSLSVPTGGGKTLAAMRFALERAAAEPDRYRRVLVVIPFLSIIEQNAAVYRQVFGDGAVFEHHSGAAYSLRPATAQNGDAYFDPLDEDEALAHVLQNRNATENWDAPIIVTTSVRFFESLFSNHPSDLRRVHNIARSVIILDEVQTLPRRVLAPLLSMLHDLTDQWGCTLLMATATQPAFERRSEDDRSCLWKPGTIREIISNPDELHRTLERVRIEWRLKASTPWPELARELLSEPEVLCVVNIREHALKLYQLLRDQTDRQEATDSLFHLSTRMCAQHRLDALARIRARLDAGLPCRVISTQLIEAGVDVDFPVAYRALGPLDAIIQVAGRVDREGKATVAAGRPAGRLIVFQTEDGRTPPHDYREATGLTASLARIRAPQTTDLSAMRRYFERYYGEADAHALGEDLAAMRSDRELKFRTLANQFEMINSRTGDVFVPYGDGMALTTQLIQAHHLDFRLLRDLQRYSVGLQPWEFEAARHDGLIVEVAPESGVWICGTDGYDAEHGLLTKRKTTGTIV